MAMTDFVLHFVPAAMQRMRRLIAPACVALVLAGCSGGDGDSEGSTPPPTVPPSTTPTPSAEDLNKAQSAKMHMTLEGTVLSISWRDTFENELGYQVERRIGEGAWTVVDNLPAADGGSVRWQRDLQAGGSGAYRVTAVLTGFSLPLYAGANESEVSIDLSKPLSFEYHRGASVGYPLRVSVVNSMPALSVDYSLSEFRLATVTSGTDFETVLESERHVRDTHLDLIADVHKSAALTIRVTAPFGTQHPYPAILLNVAPSQSFDDTLTLTAMASSAPGIVSVEFFANGNSVRVVRSPDQWNRWVHTLDMAALPSGMSTFRATATDFEGHTISVDFDYTLEALPSLTVEDLFDGKILAGGRLSFHGAFGNDVSGAVLSVDLDGNTVLKTRTSPFTMDRPVAGPTGEHTVTIRVEAPDGKVSSRSYLVHLPSTTRRYELVATDVAKLLASDQGALLYQKHSGSVVLRDAAGVVRDLPVPTDISVVGWRLNAGRAVAQEINRHLHAFDASGTHVDLITVGGNLGYIDSVVLKDDWVSWNNADGAYNVYNWSTGVMTTVVVPDKTVSGGLDMDVTAGSERLVIGGKVNGIDGIYSQWLATNTTDLLVATTSPYVAPRTDGTRLVWLDNTTLKTAPLANPAASTDLGPAGAFQMESDLTLWNNEASILVNDGTTTTTLAVDARSYALKDGQVVFADSSKLHGWSASAGAYVLLDAVVPAMHSQGIAYLLTGDGALYRTAIP